MYIFKSKETSVQSNSANIKTRGNKKLEIPSVSSTNFKAINKEKF
jgi:hypothetical protein